MTPRIFYIQKIYDLAVDKKLAEQRVKLILATGVAERYVVDMLEQLYLQTKSNRDFIDELAIKHCGDVY